jgi:hypothetical protein
MKVSDLARYLAKHLRLDLAKRPIELMNFLDVDRDDELGILWDGEDDQLASFIIEEPMTLIDHKRYSVTVSVVEIP